MPTHRLFRRRGRQAPPIGRLDEAVGQKQNYETKQFKSLFHGEEGRADMKATVALTEKARAPLVAEIRKARVSVTHTVKIEAVH